MRRSPSKRRESESFWLGEHIEALGGSCAQRGRGTLHSYALPYLDLYVSSLQLHLGTLYETRGAVPADDPTERGVTVVEEREADSGTH